MWRLSAHTHLDLCEVKAHVAWEEEAFHTWLVGGEGSFRICKAVDLFDFHENSLAIRCKNIAQRADFIYRERGAHTLYVGYPFVHGKLGGDFWLKGPLILFPTELVLKEDVHGVAHWTLCHLDHLQPIFNPSLAMVMQALGGVVAHLQEMELQDFRSTTRFEWRKELLAKLLKMGIQWQYDSSMYSKLWEPVEQVSKADWMSAHPTESIKVFPRAVLGIFSPGGSVYQEYEEWIQTEQSESLELYFEHKLNPAPTHKSKVREEQLHTLLPYDDSQLRVLKALQAGESMVVQGPPGSGKSQLIANVLANAMAHGKKVLLVSQKRAALDVVLQRMKMLGMEDFIALIHDHHTDRAALYRHLLLQYENIESYKRQNAGVDTIFLERNYLKLCRRIEELESKLEEFGQALFEEVHLGISAHELYLTARNTTLAWELPVPCRAYKYSEWMALLEKLRSLWLYRTLHLQHPWWMQHGASVSQSRPQDALQALDLWLRHGYRAWLWCHESKIRRCIDWWSEDLFESKVFLYLLKCTNKSRQSRGLLLQKLRLLEAQLDGWYLDPLEQDRLQIAIDSYMQAESWMAKIWWKWTSPHFKVLKGHFGASTISPEAVHLLQQKLALISEYQQAYREWRVFDGPDDFGDVPLQVFEHSLYFLQSFTSQELDSLLRVCLHIPSSEWVSTAAAHLSALEIASKYFDSQGLSELISYPQLAADLRSYLPEIWEERRLHDAHLALLSADELLLYHQCIHHLRTGAVQDVLSDLLHATLLHMIQEKERRSPSLLWSTSPVLDDITLELERLLHEKSQISSQIVALKAREHTYRHIEKNRLGNATTYRNLHHQLSKKRQIWPLRRLFAEFHAEIGHLVPCWLMSPEVACDVVPPAEYFDIVVFDEASQCEPELALPVTRRGKQLLVVGDSCQLPPSDLYALKWEEPQDTADFLDVDTFLQLASAYLPTSTLVGHYRSTHADLIRFSNVHFYNQRLEAITSSGAVHTPLEYIYVPHGTWRDHVNKEEAQRVAELCLQHTLHFPEESIAAISFNVHQQQAILQAIESHFGMHKVALPPSLLVRNIENIQGDERDLVILSVGYAKDGRGRMPPNFGLLSRDGGENRLNVAISRARRRMWVVASIQPQDLQVGHSLHVGPRLLRDFLVWVQGYGSERPTEAGAYLGTESLGLSLMDQLRRSFGSQLSPVAERAVADATYTLDGHKHYVLTEDRLYAGQSVRSFFVQIPARIRHNGWKCVWAFSRNFWKNPSDPFSLAHGIHSK